MKMTKKISIQKMTMQECCLYGNFFSGWSFIDGYKKDDIVKVMISKI
jgi:hypothetical protein